MSTREHDAVEHVESSDGAKIAWRATGSGPPLVLCTASFCTHLHWSSVEEPLAEFARVVSWDYRGHGLSDAPDDPARYTLDQVVADLGAVCEAAIGPEPAFVGGLSVGGLVALSYALAHPERVRGVLLFNTGPGFRNPEALAGWNAMLEKAAKKMEAVGLEEYVRGRRAADQILGLDPEAPAAARPLEGFLRSSVAGLTHFARGVAGPVPNLVDRLHEVATPALILVGELDAGFQRAGEVMAAKLPHARHTVVPGAGHVMNLDRPEAFVTAVRGFLRDP